MENIKSASYLATRKKKHLIAVKETIIGIFDYNLNNFNYKL
jgi:hypothetical protein